LIQNDYLNLANLIQCETVDDLKLHLQSTDYGYLIDIIVLLITGTLHQR
jgi:vacuolar-type H+-ATPase subunit C/Vma6